MLPHVNYEDFQSAAEKEQDRKLLVRFFIKERPDPAATITEGRPIFKDVEYMEIRIAGKRDPQACRPVTLRDKKRFEDRYERFKKRIAEPNTGTPLKEWPRISRSRVEELAFFNVKTVEQLCDMQDVDAGKLQGGLTLKYEAQKWLEDASETALIAEKEALKARVGDLESQLSQVLAKLSEQQEEVDPEPEQLVLPIEEPAKPLRRTRQKKG